MLRPVQLVIVRHAEAAAGEPDELRPLTSEGRQAARALGEQLAADGVRPDAILSSPRASVNTATGFPASGVSVKTSATT